MITTPTITPTATTTLPSATAGADVSAMREDLGDLLAQARALGLSVEDLLHPGTSITIAEFVAKVLPTAGRGNKRNYTTYLNRFAAEHAYGSRPLSSITHTDVATFVAATQEHAVATRGNRRNSRDGRGAAENAISALRWLFKRAMLEDLASHNPASTVAKPARAQSPRQALTATQLAELFQVSATGGNDPALDSLLTRFFVESGARREGVLALRLRDIDPERCTVLLREKFDKNGTEQPVSPSTIAALTAFAAQRGSVGPNDAVFRYKPARGKTVGTPLTRRRFNTLADRWQNTLPFAARQGVSPHTLRHTAIGMVETATSFAIARAFARHHSTKEVTTTYLQRNVHDVAYAVELLTGEEHPLSKDRWKME
jgi:integrase/recombinase XerC